MKLVHTIETQNGDDAFVCGEEPAEVIRASGQDTSRSLSGGGVLGISNWEETLGQT